MLVLSMILSASALLVAALCAGLELQRRRFGGPRIAVDVTLSWFYDGDLISGEHGRAIVRNRGRMTVFISHMTIRLPDGSGSIVVPDNRAASGALGGLAGGEQITVELPLDDVRDYLAMRGLNRCEMVVECHLGSGAVYESKGILVRGVPRRDAPALWRRRG